MQQAKIKKLAVVATVVPCLDFREDKTAYIQRATPERCKEAGCNWSTVVSRKDLPVHARLILLTLIDKPSNYVWSHERLRVATSGMSKRQRMAGVRELQRRGILRIHAARLANQNTWRGAVWHVDQLAGLSGTAEDAPTVAEKKARKPMSEARKAASKDFFASRKSRASGCGSGNTGIVNKPIPKSLPETGKGLSNPSSAETDSLCLSLTGDPGPDPDVVSAGGTSESKPDSGDEHSAFPILHESFTPVSKPPCENATIVNPDLSASRTFDTRFGVVPTHADHALKYAPVEIELRRQNPEEPYQTTWRRRDFALLPERTSRASQAQWIRSSRISVHLAQLYPGHQWNDRVASKLMRQLRIGHIKISEIKTAAYLMRSQGGVRRCLPNLPTLWEALGNWEKIMTFCRTFDPGNAFGVLSADSHSGALKTLRTIIYGEPVHAILLRSCARDLEAMHLLESQTENMNSVNDVVRQVREINARMPVVDALEKVILSDTTPEQSPNYPGGVLAAALVELARMTDRDVGDLPPTRSLLGCFCRQVLSHSRLGPLYRSGLAQCTEHAMRDHRLWGTAVDLDQLRRIELVRSDFLTDLVMELINDQNHPDVRDAFVELAKMGYLWDGVNVPGDQSGN